LNRETTIDARLGIRNALFAGVLALVPLNAFAASVKIVANRSLTADSIAASELRSIFLAQRNSLHDGSHVQPVFEKSGPAHQAFLRDYLKEDNETLQAQYYTLVFTGKASMPKTFSTDAEVLAYVARTNGAIGYVAASANTDAVKVLEVIEEGSKSNRALLVQIEPEYPETLKKLGIGGTVRLQVIISPKGSVESASLLGGNPILGDAAIAAVKKWVYAPASSRTTTEVAVPFEPKH
jgi:TonB family protein